MSDQYALKSPLYLTLDTIKPKKVGIEITLHRREMSPLVSLGETPENKNLYKELDQCAES